MARDICRSFTYNVAAKTSWRRYEMEIVTLAVYVENMPKLVRSNLTKLN